MFTYAYESHSIEDDIIEERKKHFRKEIDQDEERKRREENAVSLRKRKR